MVIIAISQWRTIVISSNCVWFLQWFSLHRAFDEVEAFSMMTIYLMLISASDRANNRQSAAVRWCCSVNCLERTRVIYDFLPVRFSHREAFEKRNGSPVANEKHVFSSFQLFDLILAVESDYALGRNTKRHILSIFFIASFSLSNPIMNFSAIEFETATIYNTNYFCDNI